MNNLTKGQELAKVLSSCSLSEIVDLCDEIAKLYGFKGAQDLLSTLAPSGEGKGSEDQEEETESKLCDLYLSGLRDPSASSMPIIKKLKDFTESTISECKALLDSSKIAPVKLKAGLLHTDADALIKEWAECGALLEKKNA